MRELPPLLRLWPLVRILDLPALLIGGIAAAAGHRWGAFVLVTDLIVVIGSHLAVGAWSYGDVMSRPWPKVPALTDDAWDE